MNLFQIILKQMRQRALSTWLTLLSVLLGTSLAIGILVLQREGDHLFGQTDFGYDVLIGPPKGSPLQLILNTVYHLDQSPGLLPYALYADLARKDAPLPNHPDYRPYVRWAVPFMVGDSFKSRRIIGTSPQMFGMDDDGKPVTGEVFQYRVDKSYQFAEGRPFAAKKFEAVVGAEMAATLKLKLYDPSKSDQQNQDDGGAFRATHGMPGPKDTPDIHKPVWKIVGILKPTGTANDRVIFVPFISLYAIAEHEEGLAEQALIKAQFNPSKIPPERMADALRAIGIDPDRLPENVKRKYKIHIGTAATAPASVAPIGDLLQDAAVTPAKDEKHDDHAGHAHDEEEDPDAYHLDADGNIVPDLPEEEWQISAVFVKTRGGFQEQQLVWNFKVIEDRAIAANPASEMSSFFRTFMGPGTTVLLVIAILVSVVAAASIMTTIYNSVSARLREIAILRALGATRAKILTLISLEAALIGLFGGLAGLIIGHALCAAGSSYLERTVGESINWARISGVEIIYLVGVVVLSFLAGLVPALKAYGTPVADNLTAS
jgi:putative ABC transport system permease protein